jgi:hypothetical protein
MYTAVPTERAAKDASENRPQTMVSVTPNAMVANWPANTDEAC